jgi:hypothetical protein
MSANPAQPETPQPSPHGLAPLGLRTAVVLAALLVAAVLVVWRTDFFGERGNGLSKSFQYDLEPYQKTNPALVGYAQTARIPVGLVLPRAVAVGPEDRVYVAGDQAVHVHAPGGARLRQINLPDKPWSLAVGGVEHKYPGRIYVGLRNRIGVFDPEGKLLSTWDAPGGKAIVTSIAVGEHDVFLADAMGRIVLRCDLQGLVLGRIGARDASRNIPGFVIPSPYFDIALAPDGLLRVVNPGRHQVEAYTVDGSLELSWGQHRLAIEGFCGCCNPAHMAILADGRFVTVEKGIPRVKIYSAEGKFECVVAGPELLVPDPSSTEETRQAHVLKVLDVAVDSRGRVLVLDPGLRSVRVFEPKPGTDAFFGPQSVAPTTTSTAEKGACPLSLAEPASPPVNPTNS